MYVIWNCIVSEQNRSTGCDTLWYGTTFALNFWAQYSLNAKLIWYTVFLSKIIHPKLHNFEIKSEVILYDTTIQYTWLDFSVLSTFNSFLCLPYDVTLGKRNQISQQMNHHSSELSTQAFALLHNTLDYHGWPSRTLEACGLKIF